MPTQPVVQNTGEMKDAPLTLVVALGASGTSQMFQDAGDGYAYREGGSRTITATLGPNGLKLDIPPNRGYQRVAAIEVIGLDSPSSAVRIDGRAASDVRYDATSRRLRIALRDEGARQLSW